MTMIWSEYEIIDGLTKKDSIAFPTDALKEGETTEEGDITQTLVVKVRMTSVWI